MKLKRHVNTECQVRMSLASLQGDVVLPWPLTTAVSVPARDWKEAPGLIVLICSEPGSRLSAVISHFKCERSRAAVTARCYRDSWLRPPGTQCSRGGRQRGEVAPPQTPPTIHLKWLFILKWLMERRVMICLYCAIEWNRLLSIHLRTKSFEMMNQGSSELCLLILLTGI